VSLLDVRHLEITYALSNSEVVAVSDVSFAIEKGECLGVVGESGCGKSTIGMSLMQLLASNGRISGGEILLNGKNLVGSSDKDMRKVRGKDIALIPQDPMTSLNPVMRIGLQIAEGYRIHHKVSKAEALKRAVEVLRMVEMPNPEERANQYPFELSGGLRQRAMIAMALVCEPQLLIADEPTTALDVTIQAQILDVLDGLREKYDLAVMLITHDMGVIAARADRVLVMYAGRQVEVGTTSEIFADMRHPYTSALLSSVPSVEGERSDRLRSIPGLPPDLSKPIEGCRFAVRCSYATDTCRTTDPQLANLTDTHAFACFNPITTGAESAGIGSTYVRSDATTKPVLVTVSNLVKDFPLRGGGILKRERRAVSAVADVSFEIHEGETFGLVGESGCGKTTIGKLLIDLETPTSGSIEFQGVSTGLSKNKAKLEIARLRQMIFQDPYASLNPRKRVRDIIAEPLDVQGGLSAAEREVRVQELLSEVGLPADAADRYPHEFSGGQRQRVGLARALAPQPKLIIADEPVSALDVSIQAQILNLMADLRDSRGLSYVFISHDLGVVRHIADRIGVMYLGRLVEVGPAHEVFGNPGHHYTQALLRAVPVPDPKVTRPARGSLMTGEIPSAINPPSGCRFRTRCTAAQDLCANERPPYVEVGEGHQVACHFPLRTAVAIKSAGSRG
jgi:oligopeptide/dipeptide ABC transporter ATP-binding protein